jgi:hypothetical protein
MHCILALVLELVRLTHSGTSWPWDGLKLSHARMLPGSNPDLPRAASRRFARAPAPVAFWVSGGLPFYELHVYSSM